MIPTISHPHTHYIFTVGNWTGLAWLGWPMSTPFLFFSYLQRKLNDLFQMYSSESEVINVIYNSVPPFPPIFKNRWHLPYSSALGTSPASSELSRRSTNPSTFSEQPFIWYLLPLASLFFSNSSCFDCFQSSTASLSSTAFSYALKCSPGKKGGLLGGFKT